MVNPFGKYGKMRLCEVVIFVGLQRSCLSKRSLNRISRPFFAQQKMKKINLFDPNPWLTPSENMQKMRFSEVAIFMGLRGFFSVERIPKQNFKIIFAPKQKLNKIKCFDQNHRLTPSENMQKWDYLKYLFC